MVKISWEQESKGTINVPFALKEELEKLVKQTPSIRVTIEPVYKTRTINQNSLFHSIVGRIAIESGATKAYIKRAIKEYAVYTGGYGVNDDGAPKSVKDATIEEMECLIECAYSYAFQNGIYLEDYT